MPPTAATSVGRPKRREPEVGGSGPAASATQPVDQRDRRGGDLRRFVRGRVRCPMVAPLGPGPRGRCVGRLHRRRAQRVPIGPRRDRQHLEPARQQSRRLGRRGPDVGQEPDLGLHPRGDRRPAGARPDRADGAHVLPAGALLRVPPGRAEGVEGEGAAARRRVDSRLYGVLRDDRGQPRRQHHHGAGRRTTSRRTPSTPPTRRPASTSRAMPPAPCCCPGSSGACGQSGLRCVLGPSADDRSLHRRVPRPRRTRRAQWVVDYTLERPGRLGRCGTRWRRRTSTSSSGSSSTGRCTRRPSSSRRRRRFSSFDGKGEISGNLTQADAQNLAQAMNFGALPVVLKAATSETVSATLGHSALVAGLGAGIAGLALVLLYVLLYYRGLGLVVISGLVLTAMALWAIISALGHTSVAPSFDLAGITGLIVSIGITVDSYIVYFERLKDETRSGRSVRTSVDRGFKSAWRTVWAADFVSLLAAIVLYLVAVGNVKGFAFFLGLSTIMDMAITWFYTRPLVILLGQSADAGERAVQHRHRPRCRAADAVGSARSGSRSGSRRAGGCRRRLRGWLVSDRRATGTARARGTTTARPWTRSPRRMSSAWKRTSTRATSTRRSWSASMTPPAPSWPSRGGVTGRSPGSTEARPASTSWASARSGSASRPPSSCSGSSPSFCGAGSTWASSSRAGPSGRSPHPGITQTQATDALSGTGLVNPTVELLGSGSKQTLNVQSDLNHLSPDQQDAVSTNVEKALLVTLTAAACAGDAADDHDLDDGAAHHHDDGQGGRGPQRRRPPRRRRPPPPRPPRRRTRSASPTSGRRGAPPSRTRRSRR